jgi:D-serine deaminase-like pyridoxal phosphate-dependent protein
MTSALEALDLDTPAVYVDLDALERNVAAMQRRCREWGVALRPHTKTHKIPEIARMQLDAGAVGITVAKIGEAEGLPGTSAFVEVDVGVGRCGVTEPRTVVEIARACAEFRGLFYWPAWLDEEGFRRAAAQVDAHVAALRHAGFDVPVVSGGSTPGASKTPLIPATTEIRPGTYVFNDANCVAGGVASVEDCALRVLVTVVSTAVPGQCVVDGGSKTFPSDATVGAGTFGLFPDRPDWTMHKMNEEHGYVKAGSPGRIGEKVWAIPSHCCATVNMHDEIAYGRNGRVEGTWRVAARGKVR